MDAEEEHWPKRRWPSCVSQPIFNFPLHFDAGCRHTLGTAGGRYVHWWSRMQIGRLPCSDIAIPKSTSQCVVISTG